MKRYPRKKSNYQRLEINFHNGSNKRRFMTAFKETYPQFSLITEFESIHVYVDVPRDFYLIHDIYKLAERCTQDLILKIGDKRHEEYV